jgi:hypothetical protein
MAAINTFGAVTVQTKKDLANTRKNIIKAGTEYSVPPYTVGLDKIAVFLNGTRLIGSYKTLEDGVAYYEPGYKYDIGSSIIFRSDIAISDEIFVTVLDGTDDSTISDLIDLGSIFNTGTNASDFGVVTPKVVSKIVDTKRIFLNGSDVVSISQDYTENKHNSLPSSKALYDALMQLQENIDQIDPDSNFFKDNTVITLPLLSPSFVEGDTDWEVENWTITVDNKLAYTRNDYANKVTVANNVFTTAGYHFLVVNIERLDSGKILVINNAGETVGQFDTIGIQYLEFIVDDPTIFTLSFVSSGVFPDESIIIKEIRLHKVTDRIRDYLIYAVENLVAEGGLASKEDVDIAIASAVTTLTNKFTTLINEVGDLAYAHIENRSNPHNVTYVQTGSAPLVHTHKTVDITDIDQFVENAVIEGTSSITSNLNNHIANITNPHRVTAAQTGAAPLVHTHKVIDITDMTTYISTVSDNITNTLKDYVDSVTSGSGDSLRAALNAHISNVSNPHNVTAAQTGAALKIHEHYVADIRDINDYIATVVDDVRLYVDNAIQENTSTTDENLATHINNRTNPHRVTAAQAGAAPIQHEHDISEIRTLTDSLSDLTDKVDNSVMAFNAHSANVNNPHNVTAVQINAAPLEHTHKVADITDIQSYLTKITDLELSVQTNRNLISGHVSDTENPHNVTYAQLGVGDIGTVFLNTGSANPVIHVPMVKRLYICETTEEVEKCKNNIPSMREMFNSWKRISHATTTSYPAIVTNPGGQPAAPSELLAWEYDETTDVVRNNTNSVSWIGLISPDKYTEYETEIIFNAKTDDDDSIGFITAFTIDENGVEHTLSVSRSPGGNNKWIMYYDIGNTTAATLQAKPTPLKWGNGNYGATADEAGYVTGGPANPDGTGTAGWSMHPNGTRIYVSRRGNIITAKTTDIGEADGAFIEDATMTIDLSSQERLTKFIRPCSIGYLAASNPYTTWDTQYFRDPSSNVYDVTRGVAIVFNQETNTWADDTTINIYEAMRPGTLGYNYLTNKLFFIRESNVERVAINSVLIKDGGGLSLDSDGRTYVDFSTMPTDKFETMLKSIRVPIWIDSTKYFYVNGSTGSDVLTEGIGETTAKPFKTIQACVDYVSNNYNLNSNNVGIRIFPGTYNESLTFGEFSRTTGHISLFPHDDNYSVTITSQNKNTVTVYGGAWYLRGLIIKNTVTAINDGINHYLYCIVAAEKGYVYIEGCDINQEYTGAAPTDHIELRMLAAITSSSLIQINATSRTRNHLRFHKGNSSAMYVFFAEHGGTIQTISSNTNQEYVTIHCEGEMSGFVVLSNGKFYSIGGGNYASKFVIDNGKAVTGKRYSLINSSICSTGNSGQEYFPGDIAGTIETDTYCVYK